MGYADSTTGHITDVSTAKEIRKVHSAILDGIYYVLTQYSTAVTEKWVGLSKEDADTLCVSSQSCTLQGRTVPVLGSARVASSSSTAADFFIVDDCWGKEVSSTMVRDGESCLFTVTRTTKNLSLETGGVLTLLQPR